METFEENAPTGLPIATLYPGPPSLRQGYGGQAMLRIKKALQNALFLLN